MLDHRNTVQPLTDQYFTRIDDAERREPWLPVVAAPASPSPVVLDSPHSGRDYPVDFDHACPLDRLRRAEDFLVDQLYAFAPELGATLISAPFPRSYIDVNRASDDIDPELLASHEHGVGAPSINSERGIGLVWRLIAENEPIYRRLLTHGEIEQRIRRCWQPYHAALDQAISAAHQRHGYVLHVNCHSMPSHSRLYAAERNHTMPFDFVVGDRDGSTASPALTNWVVAQLRSEGFAVGVNDVFKGAELIRRHGDPVNQRLSLQLEINKQLYMDEQQLALHSGFPRLQATLKRLIEGLISGCRGSAAAARHPSSVRTCA